MDEESQNGPKISLAEIIVVGLFFAIIDIIDLIGLFLALPLSDFTSILAFPASQLYAFLRGIRQDMLLISNGLELVPYVGSLPLRTVAFGITAYAENHPKIKAALGVAEKLTGKGEGAKAAKGERPLGEQPGAKEAAERPVGEQPGAKEAAERPVAGEEESIKKGEVGGAYEYKAQPGLEETLKEGSEHPSNEDEEKIAPGAEQKETGENLTPGEKATKAAEEQEEVFGGKTEAPVEKMRGELLREEPPAEQPQYKNAEVSGEAAGEKERAVEKLSPEEKGGGRVDGVYEQKEQAMGVMSEKELFEEAGGGTPSEKSKEVEADANMVNLRGGESGGKVIDAAKKFNANKGEVKDNFKRAA